jgi:hypothetical protein
MSTNESGVVDMPPRRNTRQGSPPSALPNANPDLSPSRERLSPHPHRHERKERIGNDGR